MLRDVLRNGLNVVFCGTAAGRESAKLQQHYAHRGNSFWSILHDAKFMKRRLQPSEFEKLLEFGIGLTDLNKAKSGVDKGLNAKAFDVVGLKRKIGKYRPRILAFTSKNAAKAFFSRRDLAFGLQSEKLNETGIWILPSTSGQARKYWPKLKHHWFALAKSIKNST